MHLEIPSRPSPNLRSLEVIVNDWTNAHPFCRYSSQDATIQRWLEQNSPTGSDEDPIIWEGFWDGDLPRLDPPWAQDEPQPEPEPTPEPVPVPALLEGMSNEALDALIHYLADLVYPRVMERATEALQRPVGSDPSQDTREA